ncbi:mannose-6-phosphate isomerase-like [Gigantopelta aegis]|uniref:mannose-6-phosphate isomerase-like n=1 Tax=Gigantopelta aegis TaxID=1735272 RepID=UPI001B88B9E3|nr:mannose-6-phosphate isomerase-like [Gigantopelta aegis]
MGTHPNGPSVVVIPGKTDQSLSDWIKNNPDSLGSEPKTYFKGELSFLFKVLSVNTSLSVQAHPHKVHAAQLHEKFPDLYKDSNHKPEMAIALTPFMGLCGFRPIAEVAKFMTEIDEFRVVVGNNNAIKLIAASRSMDMVMHREVMKECFSGMMMQDKDIVKRELESLMAKVKSLDTNKGDAEKHVSDVLLKLSKEFPGDVGAFSIYFLNIITLVPGEAMFLEANLPHAYLSGDCMECMACSDNVVRAGLTFKYVDVHTLVEMLDYTGRSIAKTKFKGLEDGTDIRTTVFKPPVYEFAVARYEVPAGKNVSLPAMDSASIVILIHGEGNASNRTLSSPLHVKRGSVFFIAANEEVNVTPTSNILMFRAYTSL